MGQFRRTLSLEHTEAAFMRSMVKQLAEAFRRETDMRKERDHWRSIAKDRSDELKKLVGIRPVNPVFIG